MIALDYSLDSPQQRIQLVNKIIEESPEEISAKYVQILSDYIIFAMDKEERKTKKILTQNRMVTVNKRETSFQGLVAKLQNGEDGIYNLMTNNARNSFLTPRLTITPQDIETIPGLKEVTEAIARIEVQQRTATGRRKYSLKKQLIELHQQQYILKYDLKKSSTCASPIRSFNAMVFQDKISIDPQTQLPINEGSISFFNPDHIFALLSNYAALKNSSAAALSSDSWYLMLDLDELINLALADNPLYQDIVWGKIGGYSNHEIQQYLKMTHNKTHTIEYISNLWTTKIPKLIAKCAEDQYLIWYYTFVERGQWKKCGRCGHIKLAHKRFFSRNSTSPDGYYSICKSCRNTKTKQRKDD